MKWSLVLFIFALSFPLSSQNVEVLSDVRISGGLNFSGFSLHSQDTFTIYLPGVTIEDGKVPRGMIVTFVSSATNVGVSHLIVDNGISSTVARPIVKKGAILLSAEDIIAGEIIMAVFDTASYHMIAGYELPAYLTDCGGTLVNLTINESHCSSCGNTCPPGHLCVGGACVLSCQIGLSNCSGNCVNHQADRFHCGGCGTVCPPGFICNGGNCVLSCQSGYIICSGNCTDTQTDRQNCGGCGTICPPGFICSSGNCVLSCQVGLTICPGAGSSTCTNLQTDCQNCGSCGNACPPGQICVNGNCVTN